MEENRELTLAISINQRNPHHNQTIAARGNYLALTFGTLLSSQGADAHRTGPSGLRRWRLFPLYAATGWARQGAPPAGLSAPRGAERKLRGPGGWCQTARTVTP